MGGGDPAAGGTSKTGTFYTIKGDVVYAIFLSYPDSKQLSLSVSQGVEGKTHVEMLVGNSTVEVQWKARASGGMDITLPPAPQGSFSAWTLRMTGLVASSEVVV